MPNAEKAGSMIKTFIEALVGIAAYSGVKMEKVDKFISDLKLTLIKVADAFRDFGKDWLQYVAPIFERGGTIFTSMKAALETFDLLAEFEGGKWITTTKIDIFIDQYRYMVEAIAWLAYQIAPQAVVAALIFASYTEGIFKTLKLAMDFLGGLAESAMPTKDKIKEFIQALRDVLSELGTALTVAGDVDKKWADIQEKLGLNVKKLMEGYVLPEFKPTYPTANISWTPQVGRPPTGGGGGGGGGTSETAEFYLKNIAEDIHDLLFIEKVKAEKAGDVGLLSEIDRLLGQEAFIWART